MTETPDKELIDRYLKAKDERALERLIYRYTAAVYGLIRVFTADEDRASDIVQETFVKAWRGLKHFDTKRDFKTWLFAIARNTAIDYLRKKQAIPFSLIEAERGDGSFAETLTSGDVPLYEQLVLQESAGQVDSVMKSLPLAYGRVICLHINEGLSFRQIAEILGQPLNTIKSRYRRGMLHLKDKLGGRDY